MIAVLRPNPALEYILEFVIVPTQSVSSRSLKVRWPERAMKLDWFFAGLKIGETGIIPSLDQSGRALSDHDRITSLVEGFE